MPVVATPSAVAMIWKWMFNSHFGIINNLLAKIGIADPAWLSDSNVAIYSVIIVGVRIAIGYHTVLLLAGLQGIPKSYYEAAFLDGANIYTIFFKIMLPLVKSGLVALAIFTALFAFKDLMWPLIANTSIDQMTLSAGLANLNGQYSKNFPQLMAGALLATWPMLVIFIVFKKKFVEGIVTTGGK